MHSFCQLPLAKKNALEANKKQWGIGAEGGAAAAVTTLALSPIPSYACVCM
jgi:hypothetical protein